MPQIVIDNVSKRFGNNVLFSNASLSIEKGSVVGIVGANGIGKISIISDAICNGE